MRYCREVPVLHPLDSDTSHFTSPIHKNRPFEVLDLDLLHDLPVEGVLKSPSHFHAVFDISPALMMMYTMQPEHRLFLVVGLQAIQVLNSSRISISARLAFV